jgi:hypothetical protein
MNRFLEKTLKPKKGKADGRWKRMKVEGKGQELGRVNIYSFPLKLRK